MIVYRTYQPKPVLTVSYDHHMDSCGDCKAQFLKKAPNHFRCRACQEAEAARKIARNSANRRAKSAVRKVGQPGHAASCPEHLARTGGAAIECRHGYDCCPECDPCTCGVRENPKG